MSYRAKCVLRLFVSILLFGCANAYAQLTCGSGFVPVTINGEIVGCTKNTQLVGVQPAGDQLVGNGSGAPTTNSPGGQNNYAGIDAIQSGQYLYGVDSGTANAYAITLTPAPTVVAGTAVLVKIANASTGASTLSVNGTVAAIRKKTSSGLTAIGAGDLIAGGVFHFDYDGTYWQTNAVPSSSNGGATIASTSNLIAGNGSGNGADSGIAASTVSTAIAAANNALPSTNAYSSLSAAYSSLCPSGVGGMTVTNSLSVGSSVAIAAGCVVNVTTGGFVLASGAVLTVSGSFTGPRAQIISGAGNVAGGFLPTASTPFFPEWVGVTTASTTMPIVLGDLAPYGHISYGIARYNWVAYVTTGYAGSNYTEDGAQMPYIDSQTAPTTLLGGTVLFPSCGYRSGSNVTVHDLGCDNGTATGSNAYMGLAFSTLGISPTAPAGYNVRVWNIASLGQNNTDTGHGLLIEGYSGGFARNIHTWFHQDGVVGKVSNFTFSDTEGRGHTLAACYLKSNVYGPVKNVTWTGCVAGNMTAASDTGYAMNIQADDANMDNVSISNVTGNTIQKGIQFYSTGSGNTLNNVTVSNASFTGLTNFAVYGNGYASGTVNGLKVRTSGGWAYAPTSSIPNVNLVFNGVDVDAASQAGCAPTSATSHVYNMGLASNSTCATVVLPAPTIQKVFATSVTIPLTQNGSLAQIPETVTGGPFRVVGMSTVITTAPVGCSPSLRVFNSNASGLGTSAAGFSTPLAAGSTTVTQPANSATGPIFYPGDILDVQQSTNASACTTAPVGSVALKVQPL